MKRTNKLIVALCIILTIISLSVVSFADGEATSTGTAGDLLEQLNTDQTVTIGGLNTFANNIIGVVRTAGVVVAVVILLVLGIKYMMGSAEEKADYKKSMIPYIVGAILIFASTTIVGIVYDMANSLNSKSGTEGP